MRVKSSIWSEKTVFRVFFTGLSIFLLFVLQVRIAPPDLAFYYSFAHSLVYDGDFCFANQYAHFPFSLHETYLSIQGIPANDWPMGTGIAWIPFLFISSLAQFIAFSFGLSSFPNGFSSLDQWTVTLGATVIYSGGSLWLIYRYCIREGFSNGILLWALCLVSIGSSYSYHLYVNSADSHPPSAFFIITFLLLWQRYKKSNSMKNAVWMGLAIGFAGLIRPHNFVFLLTPLLDLFLLNFPAKERKTFFLHYGITLCCAFLAFFPQLLVWKTLYGAWLAVPRSGDVLWTQPVLYKTLFSDFHGMISWSPLFGLGLLGLFLKRKYWPLLIPVLLLLYVYSCNLAWWCGGSFGNRRMVCCAPIFILGLAALFEQIPKLWLKIVAVLCGFWTLSVLLAEVAGTIQLDHYQSWKEIIQAIRTGWFPGLTGLFSHVNWSGHTLERLTGFTLILLILWTGILFYPWISRYGKHHRVKIVLSIGILFNLVCAVAAIRTQPAALHADLSGYKPYDRFTWVVYYERGFYEFKTQQTDNGLESMLAATIIEPGHPEAWMYLAYVCKDIYQWNDLAYHYSHQALIYGKRTDRFLQFFDRLLTERLQFITESPEVVYNQRGIIRATRKNYVEAQIDFQKALSLNSGYQTATHNLDILEMREQGGREPFIWEKK